LTSALWGPGLWILVFCGSPSENGFYIFVSTHDQDLTYTQVSLFLLDFTLLSSEEGINDLNDGFGECVIRGHGIFENEEAGGGGKNTRSTSKKDSQTRYKKLEADLTPFPESIGQISI